MKNGGMFGFPSPARKKQRIGLRYRKSSDEITEEQDRYPLGFYVHREANGKITGQYSSSIYSLPTSTAASAGTEFANVRPWPTPCKNPVGDRVWTGGVLSGTGNLYPLWENGAPPTYFASGLGFDFGRPVTPWFLTWPYNFGISGSPTSVTVMYSHNGRCWYNLAAKGIPYWSNSAYDGQYCNPIKLPRYSVKARYWGLHHSLTSSLVYSGSYYTEAVRIVDSSNKDFVDELRKEVWLINRHMHMPGQFFDFGVYNKLFSPQTPIGAASFTGTAESSVVSLPWTKRALDQLRGETQSTDSTTFKAAVRGVTKYGIIHQIGHYDRTVHPASIFELHHQSVNGEYKIVPLPLKGQKYVRHDFGEVPEVYMYFKGGYNTACYVVHPEFLNDGTTPGAFNATQVPPDPAYTSAYQWETWAGCTSNLWTANDVTLARPSDYDNRGWLLLLKNDPSVVSYGSFVGTGVDTQIELFDLEEIGMLFMQFVTEDIDGNPDYYSFVLTHNVYNWDMDVFYSPGVEIVYNRIKLTGTAGGFNALGRTCYYIAIKRWQWFNKWWRA
jgi:hypothetical protein